MTQEQQQQNQQPYGGFASGPSNPGAGIPPMSNPGAGMPPPQQPDDTGLIHQKLTAILHCDMRTCGRLLELVATRGQIAYDALNRLHTMAPHDRANVKAEITRMDMQIAQLLAL
ncbi:MAG: hypothetical protein EHJ95_05250 [Methanobacteriota archaeon]|nr:MAG: hypothetical protein EHJ95_05250 [Euryarchaeota archaeon]